MDEVNQNVLNAGRKEMRDAGISFGGQIQLPLEYRETPSPGPVSVTTNQAGVDTYGKELIQTDKFSLMEPLTNKLVFTELGATYLNVTNNVSVPKMSALNAGWVGEIEDAANTTATFETVDYTPKRISAYIDISKTLLYQDGTGVENMIRNQIVQLFLVQRQKPTRNQLVFSMLPHQKTSLLAVLFLWKRHLKKLM